MREIKFRIFNGIYMDEVIGYDYNCRGIDKDVIVVWDKETGLERYCTKDVELMQYTGLKDINGKEIYEGDIVHHEAWAGAASLRKDIIGPVIFTDGCFAIKTRYGNKYLYTGINKVIGNIYENSELVEDTK